MQAVNPGSPDRVYHVKGERYSQTMVGLGDPVKVGEDEYVANDYYNQSLVGFDGSGTVRFRAPTESSYVPDLAFQKQANQVCFRSGDAIGVIEADTGRRVATLRPKGLESLSDLVALSDGRFAVNTRNQDNLGVITTFDPHSPDKTVSATVGFIPLTVRATEGDLIVAERTDHLAVVRDDQVLFESDRIASHNSWEEKGKLWCLESIPNRYRATHQNLVGIDSRTGEVEIHPFDGHGYQIFGNERGQFLITESGRMGALTLRWLEPGQPAGEPFELPEGDLQQVHLDGSGEMLVVTRGRDTDLHRVYRLQPWTEPELLHQQTSELWLSVAKTDQGLLAFSRDGVTQVETGKVFANLTELVQNLGVPRVLSRQYPALASGAARREARVDEVFKEVRRWTQQPDPLATMAGDRPLPVSGGLNLALAAGDLPAVVEHALKSNAAALARLTAGARTALVAGTRPFAGLPGWTIEPGAQEIAVRAPFGQTARRPIHVPDKAFVTVLEGMQVEGSPFVGAGFSDGSLVWAEARDEGRSFHFNLGAPVLSLQPHEEGGLIASAADGSVHYLNFRSQVVEATGADNPAPVIFQDEDFIQIGDVSIAIEH